jgi:hypothetical protein
VITFTFALQGLLKVKKCEFVSTALKLNLVTLPLNNFMCGLLAFLTTVDLTMLKASTSQAGVTEQQNSAYSF